MTHSETAGVGAHVSRKEGRTEKRLAEARDWSNAEIVGRTITINRPRADVCAFWRDFQNLARPFRKVGPPRAHWAALLLKALPSFGVVQSECDRG